MTFEIFLEILTSISLILTLFAVLWYARQTQILAQSNKELVKITKESVEEAKKSFEEYKITGELDFLERRLVHFHEPIHASLYSLIPNLEKYISNKTDITLEKLGAINESLKKIWDTNEKYGYMTSESFNKLLRNTIVDCLDLITVKKRST